MALGKTRFSDHGLLGRWGDWPGTRTGAKVPGDCQAGGLAGCTGQGWSEAPSCRPALDCARHVDRTIVGLGQRPHFCEARPVRRLDDDQSKQPRAQRRLRDALEGLTRTRSFPC